MSKGYAIVENQIVVNTVIADEYYANSQGWILLPEGFGIGDLYVNGKFTKVEPSLPSNMIKLNNETTARNLLITTDWTELPAVSDPKLSDPYLTNKSEFLLYRNQLRAIAINPPETLITEWPTKPDAIWSN